MASLELWPSAQDLHRVKSTNVLASRGRYSQAPPLNEELWEADSFGRMQGQFYLRVWLLLG